MPIKYHDKLHLLHFQHAMYDLEKGYFEVLERGEFCRDLQHYLQRLLSLGHKKTVVNILEKVGTCVVEHKEYTLRLQAIGIVAEFTKLLRGQRDKDIFRIVAMIMSGWIRREREYHPGYELIFTHIGALIKKMFSLQLWHQAEPLVMVSRGVHCGTVPTDIKFKKIVNKLRRDIADQKTISVLIQSFLQSKNPDQVITGDLLKAMAPHSSAAMIHSLFKCTRKEIRLHLLKMIPEETEGVLPLLIERLKDKQPWYVVRNGMILLSFLGDPDLYSFARPFLCHPDSRVQGEVLRCIVALGGENVSDRLISAASTINDDVKCLLINLLSPLDDPNIQILFIETMEQRTTLPSMVRDELVRTICCSGKIHASQRGINVLRAIVREGDSMVVVYDPALDAARKLLGQLKDSDAVS
ncbi:MAG: hypothetical protein COA36_01375 [Desulfotalea sp.]|nr:MAG: hypothetical protein COA36_01375 [Desulfotalea sp.]